MKIFNRICHEGGGAQGPLTFFRRVMANAIKNFPLRTIYLGIMYMDELYQMIIFALKHYDNWKDYIIGQIFHFVF